MACGPFCLQRFFKLLARLLVRLYGVYTAEFDRIPDEVCHVVGVIVEFQSASSWIPLVEVKSVFLCIPLVVVEREPEALFVEQAKNGLWNLDPMPFNACGGAINASNLDDLVEFE